MMPVAAERDLPELHTLAEAYLRERIEPHPLLAPVLLDASACLTGSVAIGAWDEQSPLELCWVLGNDQHELLSRALREVRLWDPARDVRLRLPDEEPFRRFPAASLTILSEAQFAQEFRFELSVALWSYRHAVVLSDPGRRFERMLAEARRQFEAALPELRCAHYYRFRAARSELAPRIVPGRLSTLQAIKRGEAAREALRLGFLSDGQPYPPDAWLEWMVERETPSGAGIVTAVRALLSAREAHTLDHAGKVLRDRVAFALQQGGVTDAWLEQWWLWPQIAPATDLGTGALRDHRGQNITI